eukprot:m.418313 g.418313  ORF g.418313 m.418313 type:complete len:263 (-) comp21290_c0_seq6:255-1043(-)
MFWSQEPCSVACFSWHLRTRPRACAHCYQSVNPVRYFNGRLGIQLRDGTLVVPGYGCVSPGTDGAPPCVTYSVDSTIRSWAVTSSDGGATWHIGAIAPAVGAAEPMAVELPTGELVINARSVQYPHDDKPHPLRQRIYIVSKDRGATWQNPPSDMFQNLTGPSCEASFVRHDELLFFANPASNIRRVNMTLRISQSWGRQWESNTLVYSNSSWYSSIATAAQRGTRVVLLAFAKDCDSPIEQAPLGDHDECKSISVWKAPLS